MVFCGRAEHDVCLFDGVHVLDLASKLGLSWSPRAAWQQREKFEGDAGEGGPTPSVRLHHATKQGSV